MFVTSATAHSGLCDFALTKETHAFFRYIAFRSLIFLAATLVPVSMEGISA